MQSQQSTSTKGESLPAGRPAGALEVVATFPAGPMPTGVSVSHAGRIFVNYPKWDDPVDFTVAELRDGNAVAFPDGQWNRSEGDAATRLVSVQSIVIDPHDRLWILDTGAPQMKAPIAGGAKLVCVDLHANTVVQTIVFDADVALETTYCNDVRFDLRRGAAGFAFITDSSGVKPGIIVVDLAAGTSWRRLTGHPSVLPDPSFVPVVEGRTLMLREPGKPPKSFGLGADGIAIGADGSRLYYCPLSSRHLFSVEIDALIDRSHDDAAVAATVRDEGEKGGAADGLESDAQGRIYATNYEHNAILRRAAAGDWETLAHDPRLLWPDTMSLAADGYLYVTANQLHRRAMFHAGHDERERPFVLFRIAVPGSTPVLLRK